MKCKSCGKEKKTSSGELCGSCASSQRNRDLKGKTHKSASWKEKMSRAFKGVLKSTSHREALSAAHTGVPLSKEHVDAIKRGQDNPDSRYRMGSRWRGKKNPALIPVARQTAIRINSMGGQKETGIERRVRTWLESYLEEPFQQYYPFAGVGVVDFYLPDVKLVIECDGDYWHSREGAAEHDAQKDAALNALGVYVLRLKETEINKDWKACERKIIRAFGSLRRVK